MNTYARPLCVNWLRKSLAGIIRSVLSTCHLCDLATTLACKFQNSHGMRFWQADVLNTLGEKYKVGKWTEASKCFRESGKSIIELCRAVLKQDKQIVSNILVKIANTEEQAYNLLKNVK